MIETLTIFAMISLACLISYGLGYTQGQESERPAPPRDRGAPCVWPERDYGDVPAVPGGFKSSSHNRGDTL